MSKRTTVFVYRAGRGIHVSHIDNVETRKVDGKIEMLYDGQWVELMPDGHDWVANLR